MKMCKLLYLLCFMALVCGAMARGYTRSTSSGEDKKPNVVLILADDMGFGDLGYVNEEVLTPVIDQLSAEGVRLGNSYVQPSCTPTRHAVMTGKYPGKSQLGHHLIFPIQPLCTPLNIKMLPQYMQDNGYETYMVGKWHLGFCRAECLPTQRGFDHFYGLYQGQQDYYAHTIGGLGTTTGYDWRDQDETDWQADGIHNMYLMNDRAVKWIDEHDSANPLFMYIAFTAPHTPLTPEPKYKDLYPDLADGRANYLGLVSMMDEAIGNVTDALKSNELYDDTLIIFSSDNGGTGSGYNGPLRGTKGTAWEGGIKALGFVHGKMLEETGYTHNGLFHATDWLPTIMGIIGADFDADIDGVDQSDMLLENEESERNEVVLVMDMMPNHMMGQIAVRKGDFKLLWGGYGISDGYMDYDNVTRFYQNPVDRAAAGLTGSWTGPGNPFAATGEDYDEILAILGVWEFQEDDIDSGKWLLFDVTNDPYEKTNLAENTTYADTVLDLKEFALEQLEEYREMDPESNTNRPSGVPTNFNGTWSTGWCDDLSMLN